MWCNGLILCYLCLSVSLEYFFFRKDNMTACSFGWWLVLVCSERKVLLGGCWWLICSERKVVLSGG
jgi:hypothetical protein